MANFRSLDLNLLRVFDVVMQERSLTKAAERLNLTQPAVSNALRRLREALEDELLVRSGQGLEPTARAVELWDTVRDVMLQLRDAISPESFDPARTDMTVHMGMIDATAALLLPHLVQILEKEAPRVSVQVMPLTTRDPRRMLESAEIDVAVGYFPAVLADLTARAQAEAGVAFEARLLYQREYVCVMNAQHPLAEQPLTLERFCDARHLLVSFSGRPYGFIDEALAARGLRRQVVMTVNQYLTAARVVAQTQLLTALPRHFLAPSGLAHHLVMRELPIQLAPVSVTMLWLRQNRHPAAIQWLLDVLQRSVKATV
ncbi:LysR family transcriptional regulator [Corticibacter populi]|uniref:LysR family transcriptional regulator n=1 Tax=Corticibacter populi TaxID=1550736 RepID=A0A3M6QHQ9_9BURK|nr:LysR family transcriptional regulator [Corticibacter populi]RMX02597.1 LysR family transcriptional regulator [Corticibacter populi]RZS32990.1 LysR family transcriptional regulator [Corticibacter populi]